MGQPWGTCHCVGLCGLTIFLWVPPNVEQVNSKGCGRREGGRGGRTKQTEAIYQIYADDVNPGLWSGSFCLIFDMTSLNSAQFVTILCFVIMLGDLGSRHTSSSRCHVSHIQNYIKSSGKNDEYVLMSVFFGGGGGRGAWMRKFSFSEWFSWEFHHFLTISDLLYSQDESTYSNWMS